MVLEIIRQQDKLKMSVFEKEELASTIRHYSEVRISFAEIKQLCQEVLFLLNKTSNNGLLELELINGLKKLGQLLWDRLLARPVKDVLGAIRDKDLVLSLDEELITVPWELLHNGNGFLCLEFNTGRLLKTKERIALHYRSPHLPLRMLILANPTGDLKSAYQEGLHIRNQLNRMRAQVSIDFKSNSIDAFYIKKNLRDYDLVHFAGHCEYDSSRLKRSGWVLSDGVFTAGDILALSSDLSLLTLVFSNACHSAKEDTGFLDSDYQEKAYSLASAFLFSGVRHYIGTVRRIEDELGLEFAQEFYARLIKGDSLGRCVRAARQRLIKEHGIAAIAWTSYLLYGDPSFILFRIPHKAAMMMPRIDPARLKKRARALAIVAIVAAIAIRILLWLPTLNPSAYVSLARSKRLFLEGKNQDVISICANLVRREPLFLASYPLLGEAYERLGRFQEALQCYFDYCLNSERRNSPEHLALAYIKIGWLYQTQGDFAKSFDFYQKAIALSRERKDRLHEALVLRKLAVWYIDKGNYDEAMELLMKSSEINRERAHSYEHRYNLACDYFDIGLVFVNKDDLGAAREFYRKSQLMFEQLNVKGELSDYYFNIGEIYAFEKQYQKALDCYLRGLQIDIKHQDKPSLVSDYSMIGELYMEMGNLQEAEESFLEALDITRNIQAPLELANAYYDLGLLYRERKNKDKALYFLRNAREIYRIAQTPEYQNVLRELSELDNQ